MRRTRIKICGITKPEDAVFASCLGVDAIGLVFYAKSVRCVSVQRAREIAAQIPPFVSKVALFFNHSEHEIQQVLQEVPVDLIQFHGNETAEFCDQFEVSYIKAIPMRVAESGISLMHKYPDARGFLLDATKPGEPGGTGKRFDWQQIPVATGKPLILAGGLTVENVSLAIRQTGCYAVDISSGVEIERGVKDLKKMKDFVEQVRMEDSGLTDRVHDELF